MTAAFGRVPPLCGGAWNRHVGLLEIRGDRLGSPCAYLSVLPPNAMANPPMLSISQGFYAAPSQLVPVA